MPDYSKDYLQSQESEKLISSPIRIENEEEDVGNFQQHDIETWNGLGSQDQLA
jgi:hypothetical protein